MREFLREHPPLIGVGAALLVVLSVFLGADLVSVAVDRSAQLPPRPLTEAASPAAPKRSEAEAAEDLQVVLRRAEAPEVSSSPSGSAGEGSEIPEEMAGEAAPPAPAGLRLQGVMVGGGVGIAVFELDGQSRTLSVGGVIDGYRIEAVEADGVLLSKGGQTTRLGMNQAGGVEVQGEAPPVLPDPDLVPPPPAPAPAAGGPAPLPPPRVQVDHAPETVPPAAAPAPAPAAGGALTRADMNAFLDQGAALAKEVRATQSARGVRLQFASSGNAMARLGLQDGDVVRSVNGEPVRTPQDLYNSYLILRHTPTVEFEVERGGKSTTVRYEFPDE